MIVWVDADACPRSVLSYLQQSQSGLGFQLRTVSSHNHLLEVPGHITVGPESQATDLAIINRLRPGDLVVTQDWGLAALVLGKGGQALSPNGTVYQAGKMAFMLEHRNALARFRRGGGHTKGPAARTKADDQRFQAAFIRLLQA
ncbi:MAG: YaiI/YqxD family protein [Bacillota bacterium]|jgi:uncharacterized protein YaiI (UPF0178 family)